MVDINTLYDKIVDWAKERKIIPNAQVLTQAGKMVSEKSEISKAFLDANANEFLDGIGDTFVTIVNTFELIKLKDKKLSNKKIDLAHLENLYSTTATLLLELDIETGEVLDNIIKEKYDSAIKHLNNMVELLYNLAIISNTSLEKCVNIAYEQIKDRKGITLENGTFIKETDPRYKEIIKDKKVEK